MVVLHSFAYHYVVYRCFLRGNDSVNLFHSLLLTLNCKILQSDPMARQSKKWIYVVIHNEITQHNTFPLCVLKSFLATINIIFDSAINDHILDDLKYISILFLNVFGYGFIDLRVWSAMIWIVVVFCLCLIVFLLIISFSKLVYILLPMNLLQAAQTIWKNFLAVNPTPASLKFGFFKAKVWNQFVRPNSQKFLWSALRHSQCVGITRSSFTQLFV